MKNCQPQGCSAARRITSIKNSNGTIGNQNRDLPECSAEPQPTVPPRAPCHTVWFVQVSGLQDWKDLRPLPSPHLIMCALYLPEATQFDQTLETFGKRMPAEKWCWSTPGIMVQPRQQS